MKQLTYSLLTTLIVFTSLFSFAQQKTDWGSNVFFTTKLGLVNLTNDVTLPDTLNLSLHPRMQTFPGFSFKYYNGKTAYRLDANYAENYTNSEVLKDTMDFFSEANHSNLDIMFGIEHKFRQGRFIPYYFAMISAGYHEALGNAYGKAQPKFFDFKIFDINVGLTGGLGFYYFIVNQLSVNLEGNLLLLTTLNKYTLITNSEKVMNNYYFSSRSSLTLGVNFYFCQK
jgi:hypothetical protein